jgi:hypothetical protein
MVENVGGMVSLFGVEKLRMQEREVKIRCESNHTVVDKRNKVEKTVRNVQTEVLVSVVHERSNIKHISRS